MNTLREDITDGVHPIARNIMAELQTAEKRIAVLEAELAEARRVSQWIPVSERLPEYPCECLVASEYRGDTRVLICEWNDGWRTVSWVKYWMLKPLPPETK